MGWIIFTTIKNSILHGSEEEMFCETGGCMAKVSGLDLKSLISNAVQKAGIENDTLIKSIAKGDFKDCSILDIGNTGLLNSIDFGPLVGDDYYIAGRISALNALSDIYVMGGYPVSATIVFVIEKGLDKEYQTDILSGLFFECNKANVTISGGHTIYGEETIVGLDVIGRYDGDLRTNNRVTRDDVIMVSKPIGSAIALRGYFHNLIDSAGYSEVINSLLKSNDMSGVSMYHDAIHAATDVTGFGLIGHLTEILNGKGANLYFNKIPIYNSIKELPYHVFLDTKIKDNYRYASSILDLNLSIEDIKSLALFDPQTNGPVIVIVDKDYEEYFVNEGYIKIGSVIDKKEICIVE